MVAQSAELWPSGPTGRTEPLMVAPDQASSATWIVNAIRAPFGSGIARAIGSSPTTAPIRSATPLRSTSGIRTASVQLPGRTGPPPARRPLATHVEKLAEHLGRKCDEIL